MSSEQIKLSPKFTDKEVTNVLKQLNVEPNESLVKTLKYGQSSPLLRDLNLEDGTLKDGKIRLSKTKNEGVIVAYDFKNIERFETPTKILGKKLSKEQLEDLEQNKPIKIKKGTKEFYVQFDKDLNKLTLKTPGEVKIPEKIAKYKLSEEDKLQLDEMRQLMAC